MGTVVKGKIYVVFDGWNALRCKEAPAAKGKAKPSESKGSWNLPISFMVKVTPRPSGGSLKSKTSFPSDNGDKIYRPTIIFIFV